MLSIIKQWISHILGIDKDIIDLKNQLITMTKERDDYMLSSEIRLNQIQILQKELQDEIEKKTINFIDIYEELKDGK